MRILVTGGSGFIGSALILHLVKNLRFRVLNVDSVTYAANPRSLSDLSGDDRYRLIKQDICDAECVSQVITEFAPDAIIHVAAETHVDRSISDPILFTRTNVIGTHCLLDAARDYWEKLEPSRRGAFRFLHVSTDEVYGSLGSTGAFNEASRYDPRSPYSASKAGSDHLVRAWGHTYGLPVIVSNCSNNYGPRQYPEKLIPLMILKAFYGEPLPIYGDGLNVRDWIHVEDHVRALIAILTHGRVGETYLVGARSERSNLQVVQLLCAIFDRLRPGFAPHERLLQFVPDRPGHDRRYAIDPSKVEKETGWAPRNTFADSLEQTVKWYLQNEEWWREIGLEVHRRKPPNVRTAENAV